MKTPENVLNQTASLNEQDLLKFEEALRLLLANDYENSERRLEPILLRYPQHVATNANLAKIAFHRQDFDKATDFAHTVDTLAPKTGYGKTLLGMIAVEQGNFIQAEKYYLSAIKANIKLANAHYNLALLYDIYFQNLEKAYPHYRQYLSLIPGEDKEVYDWTEEIKYTLSRGGQE